MTVSKQAPKLCKDCLWFDPSRSEDTPRCVRAERPISLVTGERLPIFCENQRVLSSNGYCGPEGRYWEPRA